MITSDDELCSEVGSISSIGGNTSVAPAVSSRQTETRSFKQKNKQVSDEPEEQNVAAEDIVLHLNIWTRVEQSPVLPPLDVNGHVPGGDGAGHLGPVSLLQVTVEGEG